LQQQQQQQQHHDTVPTGLTSSSSSSPTLSFFPVFTLVRDPVDRFLSAFQQVMHYNDELRSSCLKRTAKATIQCAIAYVRQKTSYGSGSLDVHLIPMAMHLRLFHETDIAISVFHLKDIRAISQYLQLESSSLSTFPFSLSKMMSHNKNIVSSPATITTTRATATPAVIHIHDRSQVKFATSKVLATMSVNDCDAQMLYDICDLYAVDVAMMHALGFETPYCSLSS
jgi:Sulfotransferase family